MTAEVWRLNKWRRRNNRGIHWAEDGFLTDTGMVRQGFSARSGGVSLPPCASLNMSYGVGDGREAVAENRRRLAEAVGFSLAGWSGVKQVHGTDVRLVSRRETVPAPAGMPAAPDAPAAESAAAEGFPAEAGFPVAGPSVTGLPVADTPAAALLEADGQITAEAGITLVTLHADCIPLYFLDTVNRAAGLAHAGWRGTLGNMAGAMVDAMGAAFGSRPEDLLVSVGPGAGPCHYEVDEPVLAEAERCFAGIPGAPAALLSPSSKQGRAYLDLWRANALLLEQKGVPGEQISLAGICTICENHLFFSHRQKDKGRQIAFLSLIGE